MRKVVVAFGTLFNNINIVRKDNAGKVIQSMKVPLAYGPQQKFLARLNQDPNLAAKVAITLPRIGFEINGISYDPSRKLNRVQKFKKAKGSDKNKLDTQFMPVPYNLAFQLYIMAKQSDDALQIVEQILPYFQPDYTLTINDMADMGIKRDVPVVLNSISYEDNYQGDFAERRAVIYNLDFTCKFYLYAQLPHRQLSELQLSISILTYQRIHQQDNRSIVLHQIQQLQVQMMMILDLMRHLHSLKMLVQTNVR